MLGQRFSPHSEPESVLPHREAGGLWGRSGPQPLVPLELEEKQRKPQGSVWAGRGVVGSFPPRGPCWGRGHHEERDAVRRDRVRCLERVGQKARNTETADTPGHQLQGRSLTGATARTRQWRGLHLVGPALLTPPVDWEPGRTSRTL